MSKRYERVIKKKKIKYDMDNGANLTEIQHRNLIFNLICPNCGWITSFLNTLCKVENLVIVDRFCETCDKIYSLNYKFDNLEDAKKLWTFIKLESTKRAYLCKIGKNSIISNYGKTCSTEDCKKHTQSFQREEVKK